MKARLFNTKTNEINYNFNIIVNSGVLLVEDNFIIEFCSNYTDENGTDIYEGDCIEFENACGVEDGYGYVRFDYFLKQFCVYFDDDREEELLENVAFWSEIYNHVKGDYK